ncbi:hypothetical protein [Yinghuangia seranimata]|uniref:hypothetical protein n=1 Tax=Yinghuangia seranimata TaxID=408067 RepID=UPI00248D3872|nr:hypothetical protein [Yinghuangia seranimata]MDI2131879.1 hypothetical protein [Yinghuangia seranimata]
MNENGPAFPAGGVDAPAGHDAHVWAEGEQERARLLLARAGDIARRIERICGTLTQEPAGG